MAKLMPLPLTFSCFSKIQIGFTFLVPADLGSPGKRAVKRVCVGAGDVKLFCVHPYVRSAVVQDDGTCYECGKRVYEMEKMTADEVVYHKSCFRCCYCHRVLR